MFLEIKDVAQCRNQAFGNFQARKGGGYLITVSLKKNALLAEYASTLLHELLHAYFTLLRLKGLRLTDRTEHKVIYKTEDIFIAAFKRFMKNGTEKRS